MEKEGEKRAKKSNCFIKKGGKPKNLLMYLEKKTPNYLNINIDLNMNNLEILWVSSGLFNI